MITLTLFIFITSGCLQLSNSINTSREARIEYLSDVEFEKVGTLGLGSPIKDDFRKYTFDLKVTHSDKIVERDVSFPDNDSWKEAFNSIDSKVRYWFDEGYEQNNKEENTVRFHKEIVFYAKGITEKEVKEALANLEFKINLESENGDITEYEYSPGDISPTD
ncbi:fructose-bisphosphate aldolase [Bacillus sp. P14.5]|uniref:fructose-bisphosphate aldolase n=1 Tax=Bacillus sp. P14.5 TaxID=1983400 RepID=UPI000DEB6E80|nr:fructose-bisphosphate aldolase [Bacillus sp. P14.5]